MKERPDNPDDSSDFLRDLERRCPQVASLLSRTREHREVYLIYYLRGTYFTTDAVPDLPGLVSSEILPSLLLTHYLNYYCCRLFSLLTHPTRNGTSGQIWQVHLVAYLLNFSCIFFLHIRLYFFVAGIFF
jgi:hypothetical protein